MGRIRLGWFCPRGSHRLCFLLAPRRIVHVTINSLHDVPLYLGIRLDQSLDYLHLRDQQPVEGCGRAHVNAASLIA